MGESILLAFRNPLSPKPSFPVIELPFLAVGLRRSSESKGLPAAKKSIRNRANVRPPQNSRLYLVSTLNLKGGYKVSSYDLRNEFELRVKTTILNFTFFMNLFKIA
ncbi:hypothetical protein CDAR_166201 [Caerostris darwini]|uniref:Uncharacterized protein n=1 Tax=Caerostris darwini TaxID=1538125 RepID=A0AAV4RV15_9ARAC|nr:hypothetical protein CDAR_166201 [Caerostris darwini]